ncbi:hypothetical protein LINGRAHAP2_LOCUS2, partial [Linum grandiflorum]
DLRGKRALKRRFEGSKVLPSRRSLHEYRRSRKGVRRGKKNELIRPEDKAVGGSEKPKKRVLGKKRALKRRFEGENKFLSRRSLHEDRRSRKYIRFR